MSQFTKTLNSVASEFGIDTEAAPHREPRQSKRPYFRWTAELTEKLVNLIDEQKTAEEISVALCVPLDRVKSKLATLKAKVPSVKPSKAESAAPKPEPSVKPTKAEPATPKQEPSTEPVPEVSTEPEAPESEPELPTNIDCMIFMAFDQLVGLVDDYDRMANCWRQAMHTIEQHLSGCVALVREHPETEPHLCKIAAIIAYDELKT